MANEVMINNSGVDSDEWEDIDSESNQDGNISVGWFWKGSDSTTRKAIGFIRFPSVNVSKGINYAGIYLWTEYIAEDFDFFNNMPTPSGTWDFTIRGMDEDNTATFSGNPYPRPQTSSYSTSSNGDSPNRHTWKEINVTTAVNAVMNRPGWNTGNAIGLVLEPINSGVAKFSTDGGTKKTFMLIRKNAEPNFKPTPKTVSAPTFPASDDYGIRISKPGINVLTGSDDDMYFTSRRKNLKVIDQGVINTTAGVVYTIPHGQTHKPMARAFFKSPVSNKRYRMPRYLPGEYQDPNADTTDGTIEVDSTNVRLMTTSNCEVYYYIYLNKAE